MPASSGTVTEPPNSPNEPISSARGPRPRLVVGHAAAAVLILALAGLLVGPRVWRTVSEPSDGARVSVSPWASTMANDEALYAPQIRAAYDGRIPVRDPYIAGADADPQAAMFWQESVGLLGRAFGDPYVSLAVVCGVMAVAAMALLYVLGFEITGSPFAAAAVLPIALMVIEILNQSEGFLGLRHWPILREVITLDTRRDFHVWSRFVSPLMVLPPFFGAVVALPRAIDSGSRRWIIVAAFALALIVYSYVFYWTAIVVALVLWALLLLAGRDGDAFRRLMVVAGLAAVIALPEIIVVGINAVSLSADAKARTGLEDFGVITSVKSSIAQRAVIGIVLSWLAYDGSSRNRLYISLCFAPLVLACFDGLAPQPWHYKTQVWAVFAIPLAIAAGAAVARRLPHTAARYGPGALALIAVTGVVHLAVIQARAAVAVDGAYAMTDDERAAFDWVDAHVSSDETVVSPSISTNMLLASLTSARVYLPDGFYSKAESDDELVDRYLRVQAAFGFDEATTFTRLEPAFPLEEFGRPIDDQESLLESTMAYYLLNWEVTTPSAITDRVDGWRSRFRALASQPNVLSAHRAGYIYCGRRERLWRHAPSRAITWVATVFQQGSVSVYRISRPSDGEARPFEGCLAD